MNRRDTLITEMGLGPVWKLRTAPDAPVQAAAAVPSPLRPARLPAATKVARPALARASGEGSEREQRILRMDWPQLKAAIAACEACGLHKTRTQTVVGVGDEQAEWMLVGEAPGAEEDARGEPFVGQAGRLLDGMLAALGMSRDKNVYIANVLKCRPPGNRNPEPMEVAQCSPHLLRQLALIQPRLILALGRFAAQALLETGASIASLRGRVHHYHGIPVIVSYHPAYLLRNLPDKAKAWEDLCFARRTMQGLQRAQVMPAKPGT